MAKFRVSLSGTWEVDAAFFGKACDLVEADIIAGKKKLNAEVVDIAAGTSVKYTVEKWEVAEQKYPANLEKQLAFLEGAKWAFQRATVVVSGGST